MIAGHGSAQGQGLHGLVTAAEPRSAVVPVIVKGSAANASYAGFTVALRHSVDDVPFCTGSIVASEWVLTARHCIPSQTNLYQVWTGQRFGGPGRAYAVDHVVAHALYDVALIKLTEIIEPPGTPIGLAPTVVMGGQAAMLTGWGTTSFVQPIYPKTLQQFGGTVYQQYSSDDELASVAGQNRGCAPGDSGGPFFIEPSGGLGAQQIGVFTDRGRATNTCFYVRISKIYDWIHQTIGSTVTN